MSQAHTDGRYPYQRIADKLRSEIEAGRYPTGSKLPSTQELEERFGVSRMTVRSAVQTLRQEGLVKSRHGLGVFVTRLDEKPDSACVPDLVDEDGLLLSRLDALNEQVQGGFGSVLERLDALEQRFPPL